MKLAYVENIRIPTEKAHGYQIMKTIEAIRSAGVDVALYVADRANPIGAQDPFAYYHLATRFDIQKLPVIDFLSSAPGPLKPLAYALERWTFLRQVTRLAPEWDCDAVYTRDMRIAEALARSGVQKPVIVELHDDPHLSPEAWKLLVQAVKSWVVISQGLKRLLIEHGVRDEQILVAHDAFDADAFAHLPSRAEARQRLGVPEDIFLAAYTGHLYPWKGLDGIAPSFTDIPEGSLLAVVGGYPEDIARVQQISGHAPRVRWTGHVSREDAQTWLAAADVAILPTSAKFEIGKSFTSPLKLFEYLASGVPVLASDVPSSHEILTDEVAMFFAPDSPEAFLKALRAMMALPLEQRVQMSDTARRVSAPFTWSARGARIAEFVRKICL